MYAHDYEERKRPAKPTKPVVVPTVDTTLWPAMEHYLENRNLDFITAKENGWYPARDREGTPRIVVPASSLANTWPYYQARAMNDHPKRYDSPSAPRGDALIVVHPKNDFPTCAPKVIVEGPMDALAAAGTGAVGIALMGCAPSLEALVYLAHLLRTFPGPCILIPDKDALVEGAKVVAYVWKEGLQCTLRPTLSKDLAAMAPEQRMACLSLSMKPT